ncbi:hypothetical protein SLS60_011313 [Paraconiothyrium brasiliense]|uniref:Iron transport multicopper oxidase FET3 n=1 Tax=Paraconiothyrium brasiliense TaxID=300254 RepID=A0ABR3QJA1_9PLEO
MAKSILKCLPLCSLLFSVAQCATKTYDFEVAWVSANPDGLQERSVIGINGQWPLPTINVTKGDQVVINVDQPGTYWYHSHVRGQYPDGLRGAFIVHDPDDPHKDLYDEEIVLTFSDWYHDHMPDLLASFISIANPSGAEPVPDSALVNETQNLSVKIEPGKRYKFRIINIGAFAAQYVWFEDHTMQVIEVDGIYTEPADAEMIYVTVAQRWSVIVTAKNDTNANFAFVGSMDEDLFDTVPDGLNPNVTGWLVYDDTKEKPVPKEIDSFEPFDDFSLVPQDKEELAFFNDQTYVAPKVPTLYTVLSTGSNATNPEIYGSHTNQFVLEHNQVVEIVLNNDDPGKHPFHLHGHAFQLVHRSDDDAGFYDPSNHSAFPATPMRRDTILVHPNGNIVLRFRSDNPGVWLFHCHIEWHVASGLMATIIEAPLDLQKQLSGKIPQDHQQACKAGNVLMEGNAAGNTVDVLDLKGETSFPGPLPAGFTARGIVALVFSCVAAFLGMGVIGWYGMAPIKAKTG